MKQKTDVVSQTRGHLTRALAARETEVARAIPKVAGRLVHSLAPRLERLRMRFDPKAAKRARRRRIVNRFSLGLLPRR